MNAAVHGLIKNLSLLFLVVFTVINFFFDRLENWAVLAIQASLGLLYLVFSITEILKTRQTTDPGEKRFFYLTNGTLAKKAIRIGAFLMGSIILYLSETSLQSLAIVIFIMLIAESIAFVVRLKLKSYFISIREKYLLIRTEKEIKVFASQISSIEYRYEIFHLTKTDEHVQQIELEKLEAAERANFVKEFIAWCEKHQLPFTDEAKVKLSL
ncbi:MAG: hypothetical protein ACJ76F_01380 [Bacteroidia bacterium]